MQLCTLNTCASRSQATPCLLCNSGRCTKPPLKQHKARLSHGSHKFCSSRSRACSTPNASQQASLCKPTARKQLATKFQRNAQRRLSATAGVLTLAVVLFASMAIPSTSSFRKFRSLTTKASIGSLIPETSVTGGKPVTIVTVVPDDQSPLQQASWPAVVQHIANRLSWVDPNFSLLTFTERSLEDETTKDSFLRACKESQFLLGFDMHTGTAEDIIEKGARDVDVAIFLNCNDKLQAKSKLLGYRPGQADAFQDILAKLPWTASSRSAKLYDTIQELFKRHSSDDLLYIFLVLINQFAVKVPMVANSVQDTSLSSLQCMITKCGQEIVSCVQDPSCSTALNCLQSCKFNDQVCSYRCIASYESPLLEQFSLCILQKHNCLGLTADVPMVPDPQPLASFKGQQMTHELAEDLFIGEFGPSKSLSSWKVAAGKNPAYDYFPCQFQLFYRGQAKNSMWYDPIFKVKTIDGQEVWRKRHYRMRRGKVPGTFNLSVLDNGVTSFELWRILDCAEDLSWCLFYYGGAAKAAGLEYSGAILGTSDGNWPAQQYMDRIEGALDRAGIKLWEMSTVDNSNCLDAPLQPIAVPAW